MGQQSIPQDWEFYIILSIHKERKPSECANLRSICFSGVLYKMYTSIREHKLKQLVDADLEEELDYDQECRNKTSLFCAQE